MKRLIAIAWFAVLVGSGASLPAASLPPGWAQIEAEGYHGPEGWFHDSESGVVLRYYMGTMPDYVGARPTTGEPCSAVEPRDEQVPCLLSETPSSVHVFIGPFDQGTYASYWATVESSEQERRAKELALADPMAKGWSVTREYLGRDATEDDLRAIILGMNVHEVLARLGMPVSLEPAHEAGFTAEFVIFSGPNGEPSWQSRFVKLTFSRERILLAGPPNNRLQRTIGADVFRCAPLAAEPER